MAQKINVQILGLDAPPDYLITVVERELKRSGQLKKAKEFYDKAQLSQNAESIVELARQYVNVI